MNSEDFVARVNNDFEFSGLRLDQLDVVRLDSGLFHILHHHRSYNAELIDADFARKEIVFRINGRLYRVALSDPYDQMVQRLGLAVSNSQVVKKMNAPMPGLVLEILIKEGQPVEKGQPLLILQAMKMENVIKSAGEGAVKKIFVQPGQAVEKNQLLIEMD